MKDIVLKAFDFAKSKNPESVSDVCLYVVGYLTGIAGLSVSEVDTLIKEAKKHE